MQFTSPLSLLWLLTLPVVFFLGKPARGVNRRRESLSLALRLLICLALILALSGLEVRDVGQGNSLAVVFLLDVSDSMPETAVQTAFDYIQRAVAAMGPDDQAALVVFGQEALVERPMSSSLELGPLTSTLVTNQTDLAQAIHLGLALYPPGAARRMVILSDGNINAGNTSEAAQVAAAAGVEVVVLPFLTQPAAEVMVSEVQAPPNLRQGDRFDLNITVQASEAGIAQIRVFAGDSLIYLAEQELEEGHQTFSLPLTALQAGFTAYQVQVVSQADYYYQNNNLSSYTQVSGPPKVLLVALPAGGLQGFGGALRPDEFTALQRALESTGFQVDLATPVQMPSELPALATYASIILVDIPARELTTSQMNSLQIYVRDLGGGLVAVGGPTSYGVGGYFRTPLEETLPVEMQIKDEERRPTLAIVFIIDHSGSMSESSGGPTKLELAKEAVIRSVELLNPKDLVGVIAFDDAASWVVPIEELGSATSVKSRVASIGIGGGTDILAGVQAMAEVMPGISAGARHVILLTDGGADPSGIPTLVEQLYVNQGITLSTIGVGKDAAAFLPKLAELGGGRYHFAVDPGSIPSIYTEETTLATRAYIIEEPFTPSLHTPSPILAGIEALPQLYGYIGTSPKEAAQTILVTHKDDPLLAYWRYGLGKAIAFTSDATGRWAQQWISWQGFTSFWSQVVRYTISDEPSSHLDIRVKMTEGTARVVIDAAAYPDTVESSASQYLNNYQMRVNIIAPGDLQQEIALRQIAPGRYEGSFQPGQEGVYLLRVTGEAPTPGAPSIATTAGWALDYSPEYRLLKPDPDALLRLAAQAGGRPGSSEPAQVFAHTLPMPGTYQPAWQFLVALAAFLLPVDIALRRLVITRGDLQRATQLLYRLARREKVAAPPLPERQEAMHGLFRAKQTAAERLTGDPPTTSPSPAGGVIQEKKGQTRSVISTAGQASMAEPFTEAEVSEIKTRIPQDAADRQQPAASSVSSLLASKRARRENDRTKS